MDRAIRVLFALLLVFGAPFAAGAQPRASITATVPTATTGSAVALVGVLADKKFDELMQNGFPLRMHLRAELWKTGVINQVEASVEWETVVRYDSFDHTYDVVRVTFGAEPDRKAVFTSLGSYKSLAGARGAAELAYTPPLPAADRGRKSYIAVQADVQTMEMSDLDEVQAWLRGDARPGVPAKRNPGTFLTRGVRSLFTRLLGAEVRHIEGQSATFTL